MLHTVSARESIPTDIILSVLSHMRLTDLCRLLEQSTGHDAFSHYCQCVLQSRAKTQAWELALYTPAGYMVALCNPECQTKLARFRCVGYDTHEASLRFTPICDTEFCVQDEPELKLACLQWLRYQEHEMTSVPLCWKEGDHTIDNGWGVCIQYHCSSQTRRDHARLCRSCGQGHAGSATPRHCLRIQFTQIQVTFDWLRRGLSACA